MKKILLAAMLILPQLSMGSAEELTLFISKAEKAPKIDGVADEAVWLKAKALPLEVFKVFGKNKTKTTDKVVMKAIYFDGKIFMLAEWNDATKNDTHKTWIWNSANAKYRRGKDREDQFSIAFPIEGKFTGDMLAPTEAIWDVWQWEAARTNPAGYAEDRLHINSFTKPNGRARKFTAHNGKKVWIYRASDQGNSPTKRVRKPKSYKGDAVAQYLPADPSGSQADISAKGKWKDGIWTLELMRKLKTGNDDDAVLSLDREGKTAVTFYDPSDTKGYEAAIALFDNVEGMRHKVSEVFTLKFER